MTKIEWLRLLCNLYHQRGLEKSHDELTKDARHLIQYEGLSLGEAYSAMREDALNGNHSREGE